MRRGKFFHALSPALYYFLASNLLYLLLRAGVGFFGKELPGLAFQAAAEAICLAWILAAFKGKGIVPKGGGSYGGFYRLPACFCYVASGVLLSVSATELVLWLRIHVPFFSAGYGHVEQLYYGGAFVLELLALGGLGPILEELIYRGMVYHRLLEHYNPRAAIVGSALIFGLFHFNLVQGIYAFGLGILFAWFYYKTENILVPIVAHMLANLLAILRTETGMFAALEQAYGELGIPAQAALLLLGLFFLRNGSLCLKKGGEKLGREDKYPGNEPHGILQLRPEAVPKRATVDPDKADFEMGSGERKEEWRKSQ